MVNLTFNELPGAVALLFTKLEDIERLLQNGQAQEPDRWLSIQELCDYLPERVVKPTVYGWVHAGTVPVHKRGKKLYFLKSEIDAWLKTGRKKTFAETEAEAEKYVSGRKK